MNADALERGRGRRRGFRRRRRGRCGFKLGNARLERRDAGFVIRLQALEFGTQGDGIVVGVRGQRARGKGHGHECRNGLVNGHDTVLV